MTKSFNPRTREGCDHAARSEPKNFFVSIHAPVKGATDYLVEEIERVWSFNPRTREGCDGFIKPYLSADN